MKAYPTNFWLAITASCALVSLTQTTSSAANLVSRYSFNETTGTNATDSVSGFNGTLRGAAAFNGSGKVVLDGTSGTYVSLPPALLNGLSAITIDAWMSFTIPNNNVHLFSIDNGSGTGSGGSYLRYNLYDSGNGHNGTNFMEGIVGWSGNVLNGGSVLPTNGAQIHLTLVYDPNNGVESIYVNGALSATYTGALSPLSSYPQTVFTLGRSPWAAYGDPYLKGSINEFRVYGGVLTDPEIVDNDAAGPDSIPSIGVGVPQITPTNIVYDGEPVVLSCGVSGPATGYYWEWDNGSYGASFAPISGATSLSYTQDTTGLAAVSYQFQYRFVVTNSSSSVTSDVAILTVNAPTVPTITVDTTPNPASGYTGGSVTFTAAFDGNHPITNQWQKSADTTTWVDLPGQTNTSLTLTNLQFSDALYYRLAATNSVGGNASSPAILTVNDASLAKFHWQTPVSFNGLNADQILTNVSGAFFGAAAFGNTARMVSLDNGRVLNFTTDGSIATATGGGTATGAYPAGTGLTTSNANFDAVLNGFSWDGGPKTITLNNLVVGETYSVQLFALDDRNTGAGESNRLANFQDPADAADVSATFKMGDNVYVIGTFTAASPTEYIQMNLPTGNSGNMNALVLRALSYTPANQPPTVQTDPQSKTAFVGHPASFTVVANSYVVPTYRWQAGPLGGPFTNLDDGGVIVGATSNVLTLTDVTGYDGAQFQVVISNPAGNTPSAAATLTVQPVPPLSGAASDAVKALSPVAYWPLNETNDPAYGVAGVYDAAGTFDGMYLTAAQNAYNGIVGVQAADGFPMFATNTGALKSTGGTDQSWATVPALNLNTNTVTIGMWIYPDGVQASAAGLFVDRNPGTQAGLGYYNNDRLGYKWNDDAAATWSFNSGLLIPTNVWSYVALVVTPTNATLYLYNTNGLQSAVNTTTHNNMSWGGDQSLIRIGTDNTIARTFNGRIDEVSVFNRSLTQAEILQAAGAAVTPTIAIQPVGNQLQLSWSSGTLLEATNLSGPWTTNANASPCLVTPTGPQKFYRVQAW